MIESFEAVYMMSNPFEVSGKDRRKTKLIEEFKELEDVLGL